MILLLSAFIATVIFLMLAFLFLHSSGEARGVKKRLGEYAGNQTKHDLSADRAEELKKTGAQVDYVPTYETGYVSSPLINEKIEFEEGTIDLAVFTSASTVKGFVESTKGLDYSRVRAACIGKQTRAAADSYGMQTYMSEKATIDSLIELVETLKRSEEKWN